ncbi:hypothetical protein WS62_15445 [Burkholderia sp. ABCPW 14]|uniref:hypothetical protein n=1 Tax=Burkholderia sp. ABCPW 14 TaxID=1637860 RepID=UPI000770DBB3|nr:hypothetical protein [Burkholderia sp. ABCPW 14]KVD89590.1 hypothetical protein WS62_15445 [Burkholderia sp. ABCPW 14]
MHEGVTLSEPMEIAVLGQPRDAELIWEYPRETPHGDQVDVIESIDVAGTRIARHRVYWGWVGFRTLVAAMKRAESAA